MPVFTAFASLTDPDLYRPLPDGWLLGLSDVVRSTEAIAAGRYKVVNTAGASVIAALTNKLRRAEFPFIFGGDGASFAIAPDREGEAREALAATAAWARDELGLELRVALVPVAAVRQQGLDVRVARFAPSPDVSYAMFAGGGLSFAEEAMKAGRFAIAPAPAGTRPDLTGLSCRWEEIKAANGVILSLLVMPVEGGEQPGFRALVAELLTLIETTPEATRPLRDESLQLRWPSGGIDVEARAGRKAGQALLRRKAWVTLHTLLGYAVFRLGRRVRGFDPAVYRRELIANSDFRKYDDGLRMVVDCTPGFADRIEDLLGRADRENVARFGLHRQSAAILTCLTPSIHDSRHVHFIDGAAGGYALAAARLKERAGLRT